MGNLARIRLTRPRLARARLGAAGLPVAASLLPSAAFAAGMPQLNFHDPLLKGQVVWGAVIFLLFYLVLSRSALPRVERVMANRRARIESDLDVALKAKRDADVATAELLKARQDAAAQARANFERVQEEARREAESRAQESARRMEERIAQAETGIAQTREEAIASLPEIATATARELVSRLIGAPDDTAIAGAVDRAMERVPESVAG